jgi:nucleoside-diphosphate-sugar epimerase
MAMPPVSQIQTIDTEDQLEELLSQPSSADVEWARQLGGDVMILGAGGKMGPSLALRARRAVDEAGSKNRVFAVSRFSSSLARDSLEQRGIKTFSCDFLDRDQVSRLPVCENVLYLAGRKFGTGDRSDLTWASNTIAPANVSFHFRDSRLVVFSTGNVYPLVAASSSGSVEADATGPVGEYAQSCLGRERVCEYFSREFGTRYVMFRLNYAVDLRYGVLVDVAWKIRHGTAIDLTIGYANVIWQGDANSMALRSLNLCESPPRILNVTGGDRISVRATAEWFANRWGREVRFLGEEGPIALLSNSSLSRSLLGEPEVSTGKLMEWVAHWVESDGAYLGKPTKYEVWDGQF